MDRFLLLLGTAAIALGLALPGEVHAEAALVSLPGVLAAGALALSRPGPRVGGGVAICAGALLVLAIVSTAAGSNRDEWRRAVPMLVAGAMAYVLGRRADAGARRSMLWILAPAVAIAAARAIHQQLWGFDELLLEIERAPGLSEAERALYRARVELGRPFGPFALPGLLGGLGSGGLLLFGGAAAGRGAIRVLALVTAALALAALGLSASLGAAFALALTLAAFGVRRVLPRRAALLIGGCVVLLLGGLLLRRESAMDPRGSLSLRVANWRAAAAMAGERPFTGVGPGAFADVYPRVVSPTANATKHAHSFAARTFAELGIPAGLVLLLLMGLVARELLAGFDAASGADLGWPLAGACLALHALVDIDMDVESFALFTPLVLGAASGIAAPSRAAAARPGAWAAVLLAVAAMVPYVPHTRGRAQVAIATDLAREDRHDLARERLGRAIEEDPASSVAHLLLGRELQRTREHREAIAHLERARDLAPERGSVHLSLAVSYAAVGRRDDACREAEQVRRHLPVDREALAMVERLCPEGSAPGAATLR